MKKIHFSTTSKLAFVACASLLTACGPSSGYYDTKGNYVASNAAYSTQPEYAYSRPNKEHDSYTIRTENDYPPHQTTYQRSGAYDHNGDYIVSDNPINVPQSMFPERGMCRVWFTNRVPSDQPPIESCDAIQTRVPAGAYVIYGG
ncbi:MAG: hypothetical protein ACOYJ2_03620 [Rickettsiales bacterium]